MNYFRLIMFILILIVVSVGIFALIRGEIELATYLLSAGLLAIPVTAQPRSNGNQQRVADNDNRVRLLTLLRHRWKSAAKPSSTSQGSSSTNDNVRVLNSNKPLSNDNSQPQRQRTQQ